MIWYELSRLIHELVPFFGNALSMILGIIIANIFWKARIHRYAKTEVVETLEYQKNKMDEYKKLLMEKDSIISDLRGSMRVAKISALKIVSATK